MLVCDYFVFEDFREGLPPTHYFAHDINFLCLVLTIDCLQGKLLSKLLSPQYPPEISLATYHLALWCSWLSLLSNTQAVPGSSPGEVTFYFLALSFKCLLVTYICILFLVHLVHPRCLGTRVITFFRVVSSLFCWNGETSQQRKYQLGMCVSTSLIS